MADELLKAVAALGTGPLTEALLARYVFPLFSRVLRSSDIYLANHSLGRPLDQMPQDVAEAVALWPEKMGNAWDGWLAERESYRERIARLIGARQPGCVVPKTSAGQGLRAVLNALPGKPHIVSTRGEFDSVDVILKQYASLDRISIHWVDPDENGYFRLRDLLDAVAAGPSLVVVSQVFFMTGQMLAGLDELAAACHASGARLLVDVYHSVGVVPMDVHTADIDFLIGGCYKYLRGGPGTAFLYVAPRVLESGLQPVDTGWFAKEDPFLYERPDPPRFAPGGDAFLESTPPVLTYYQARAGQQFTLGVGVDRLRAYSVDRLTRLKRYLEAAGINAGGGDPEHGAFLTVRDPRASELAAQLAGRGIHADARNGHLRLSPDCLTRDDELRRASKVIASVAGAA